LDKGIKEKRALSEKTRSLKSQNYEVS